MFKIIINCKKIPLYIKKLYSKLSHFFSAIFQINMVILFIATIILVAIIFYNIKDNTLKPAILTSLFTVFFAYLANNIKEYYRKLYEKKTLLLSLKSELEVLKNILSTQKQAFYESNQNINKDITILGGIPIKENLIVVFNNVSNKLGLLENQKLSNSIIEAYSELNCFLMSSNYHQSLSDKYTLIDYHSSFCMEKSNYVENAKKCSNDYMNYANSYIEHLFSEYSKEVAPSIDKALKNIDRELEKI